MNRTSAHSSARLKVPDAAAPGSPLLQHELATFRELEERGELRGALRTLHRACERDALESWERGLLSALLARGYARLHCLDEASTWLRAALAARQRDPRPVLRQQCELAQVTVRLREGRSMDAATLGERLIGRTRVDDRSDQIHILELWFLVGQAHLQMDGFRAARDCAERILCSTLEIPDELRARALLLRGEARLWAHILSCVAGRLGVSDERRELEDGFADFRAAGTDFVAAAACAPNDRWMRLAIEAGLATTRVLRFFNYGDLQTVNRYIEALERVGLRLERDRARVVVAFLHLRRGRYELTKGWSQSIELEVESTAEKCGPQGALLVLAAACKGLGDEDRAGRLHGSYSRRRALQRQGSDMGLAPTRIPTGASSSHAEGASIASSDRRALLVARAARFVEQQGDGPRHVDVVCEALGVSRRTLEMAFRAVTGESPKRYFDSLRTREAALLMREFAGPLSRRASFAAQLAQRCGFSSYRAFARIFTQQHGMSPVVALSRSETIERIARDALGQSESHALTRSASLAGAGIERPEWGQERGQERFA